MPSVSLIVPCYNEQATIDLLLEAILKQTYPLDEIEVIIADGMSTDATRDKIAAFQDEHPQLTVRLIDNHKRIIPAALNRAMEAAQGEIFIRLDAHSVPRPNYVETCVTTLKSGLGDNVGGVWKIRPGGQGVIAAGIAAAAAHPLGVGDAHYRVGAQGREADTVPFGAFKRSLVEKIGLFDETLLSNEDYEFNVRIRKAGYTIWLNPEIETIYFARPTLSALARQYWRYGYWKLRMLMRYPETFRWRQLSGAFVLTWLGLGTLSIWFKLARWTLLAEAVIYSSALLIAGIQSARKRQKPGLLATVPFAIATMHFSWGTGFLWSLIQYPFKSK